MSLNAAMPGLGQMLSSDPPQGSVLVVLGPPGSIKSGMSYSLMAKALDGPGDLDGCGIYITLDESRASIEKNLTSLGIAIHPRIQVADLASFIMFLEDAHKEDLGEEEILGVIAAKTSVPPMFALAGEPKARRLRPRYLAIDSLNGLMSLTKLEGARLRRRLSKLLYTLRQQGLTSFLILETTQGWTNAPELHLADGVIELGFDKTPDDLFRRFVWIRKMRSTEHTLDPYLFEVTPQGLSIVGILIGEPTIPR